MKAELGCDRISDARGACCAVMFHFSLPPDGPLQIFSGSQVSSFPVPHTLAAEFRKHPTHPTTHRQGAVGKSLQRIAGVEASSASGAIGSFPNCFGATIGAASDSFRKWPG